MSKKITEQDLAEARLLLAYEILQSENAEEILAALHNLMIYQSTRAFEQEMSHNKKKKKEAREWKRASDEFFTILMCAMYQRDDAADYE